MSSVAAASKADVLGGEYGTPDEHGDTHETKNTVHSRLRATSSIMQLKKIMVANRGEIPIRIFRTAHELSLQTVAIYSYEDRLSMHRQKADEAYVIGKRGEYTPVGAYLAIDEIVKIAKQHDVNMIHPGYGFLSENAEFAKKVEDAGMIFVGPRPETISGLGDKVSARELANKCKVPVVPGTDGPVEKYEEVKDFTDKHGFPIIIKAAFGGGGRGMRVVWKQEELKESFERATSEAKSAFGNGTVFVERFLYRPKHIEVQLLGDNHGNVVHLFERDCSVQRRHQKVVELAPAKDLPQETRDAILNDAVTLAKSANYRNAGTAEFLVDQEGNHFFIEINPRIQVEHTITEEITGIDIIAAQIQIAAGATLEQLNLTQDRISTRGFAMQARITTEDPAKAFAPDTGKIEVYRSAGGNGVRLDASNGFAGAIITHTRDHLKNPSHALVMPTKEDLLRLAVDAKLEVAPGVMEALQSDIPPQIVFFEALPGIPDSRKYWAVYILVLRKAGQRPKIYIGSGTCQDRRIARRFQQYDNHTDFARFVQAAIDLGYHVVHKGLLCWTPLPGPTVRHPLRCLMLAMETTLSFALWAMVSREKDYGMPDLCKWGIDELEYLGCCGHSALQEGVRGEKSSGLSPEELDGLEASRLQHRASYSKVWGAAHRDLLNAAIARTQQKNRDLKRWYCDTCDVSSASEQNHVLHMASKHHKDKVAGTSKPTTKHDKWRASNLAAKKFTCSTCGKVFMTKQAKTNHLTTKRHLKQVASLAAVAKAAAMATAGASAGMPPRGSETGMDVIDLTSE
ncbi:Pyruvate carboxylase [Elsinoe australis]|uniref:Pyruvate carboxylase n=1 Tax=Elsinoe australis TaxID=40998 RepID=A0A2P8ABQ6_9PEZI|nr:Pyruvate carboxylase [Elsinoe australis]